MGQVVVTFGAAVTKGEHGAAPVMSAYIRGSEELASSGTSVATTMTAGKDDIAAIRNNDAGAIWVAVGDTPVAAVESDHFVLPGEALFIGGLKEGHKIAVIDDS